MPPKVPQTRSQTRQANRGDNTDEDTEDDTDFETTNEDDDGDEEITVTYNSPQPKEGQLAEVLTAINLQNKLMMEQMEKTHQNEMRLMRETLENITIRSQSSGASGTKAKKTLCPVLGPVEDIKLMDFISWRESYEGYSSVMKLDSDCDLKGRRTLLRNALDTSWQKLWTNKVLLIDKSDDVPQILDNMQEYIRQKRNPILDRQDFFHRNQRLGENIDMFLAELQSLYDGCSYEEELKCFDCERVFICPGCNKECADANRKRQLRDQMIIGLRNEAARERVLEEDFFQLTLERAHNIIKSVEASRSTVTELKQDPCHINEVTKGDEEKSIDRIRKSTYKKKSMAKGTPIVNCTRCGSNHDYGICPAWESNCHYCKERGHWEKMCRKKQKDDTSKTQHLNMVHIRNIVKKKEVPIIEMITKIGKVTRNINWLLDSGAEACVMDAKELESFGKLKCTYSTTKLMGADQGKIKLRGKVVAIITHQDKCYQTEVFLVPGVKTPIMCLDGLKKLGFLDINWPYSSSRISVVSLGKEDIRKQIIIPKEVRNDDLRNKIFTQYPDVFPPDDAVEPLKPMKGPAMKIELTDDAIPFKRYKANSIPHHLADKVKEQLDLMVKKEIIETVPLGEIGDWVLVMVAIPKPGKDEVRITIDFQPINKYVKRQGYPTKTPSEEIAQIPKGMKYFTVLDSRHGYWQVLLEEGSRHLTTFITPWGHYRFKRNVMGLINAGDEHNMRGDRALEGVPNVKKIVEDVLIYDEDYDTHIKRINEVLERCKEYGITLSRKKAHFAQDKVEWCGYTLSKDGYTVSEKLVQSLKSFPTPKNRTDVRSFNGLVQQFESMSPHLTDLMEPIRALLSPKVSFLWTEDQQCAFDNTIKELMSPRILTLFQKGARLRLETDAAQKTGFGFALWQEETNGQWKLLRCGSRTVSPAESRYSVIESELTAVVYSMIKLRLYLEGVHFTLIVDHKPLIPILNKKTLDEIHTPRVRNLKEKLSPFTFTAVWRKGVDHKVADVFSRYPVTEPTEEDLEGENELENYAKKLTVNCIQSVDLTLDKVKNAANQDKTHERLKILIQNGFPTKKSECLELGEYWNIREELCVIDDLIVYGQRLLIPTSMRSTVLKELHVSHQGQEKTINRARQCVFWPGIINDVKNMVQNCPECEINKASQRKEPLMQDLMPSRPGEAIAADLFTCEDREYLVITDKYSGWPEVRDFTKGVNTANVQKAFIQWFLTMGVPNRLTTDNGPQFRSAQFAAFCKEWGILHDPSSPYHHVANGYAEAAVKCMKSLVKKICPGRSVQCESFWEALLEYRNMPRKDGLSPAQRLFQRPMRTKLPCHPQVFEVIAQSKIREADKKALLLREKAKFRHDLGARPLNELKIGDIVRVQHHLTKKWDLIAEVMRIQPRRRSYLVKSETGRLYWRNRRYLKLFNSEGETQTQIDLKPNKDDIPKTKGTRPTLRRSGRVRKPPDFYKP